MSNLLFSLLCLGFSELLLPGLLHFLHGQLIRSHLFLHLLQFSLCFKIPARWHGATTGRQLLLQLVVLLFEHPDKLILGVLINYCFILNLLGTASVPQRADSLLVVEVGRGDGADHNCFRVASKRVLQHSGERRVTVGYHDALTLS